MVSFLSNIARLGLVPAVTLGNLVTAGIEKVTGTTAGRQTAKELSETTFGKALGVATAGTAVALGVVASPKTAVKAVKSVIPKSTIGKAGAVVVAGALAVSPKLQQAVIETPGKLFSAGKEVGGKIEGMTDATTEKASKYGATGLIVAGVAGVVAGAVGEKILGGNGKTSAPSAIVPQESGGLTIAPPEPTTQEMVTLDEVAKTPVEKTATEPRRQTISQKVNIVIRQNNRNYSVGRKSVKYLNPILYA